ncbi:hypothetical protein HJG60_009609 [Phyllostomus discolor]|uniref:Uncharacterized protein n=1 Tax=Phyllostomus discolor TaxID=89673 RepID=A0A833YI49_9CHIR|nr:hypothetical protein HJG60_009609 [Phyllostomus discolor]
MNILFYSSGRQKFRTVFRGVGLPHSCWSSGGQCCLSPPFQSPQAAVLVPQLLVPFLCLQSRQGHPSDLCSCSRRLLPFWPSALLLQGSWCHVGSTRRIQGIPSPSSRSLIYQINLSLSLYLFSFPFPLPSLSFFLPSHFLFFLSFFLFSE